jgi:hypothetical protein
MRPSAQLAKLEGLAADGDRLSKVWDVVVDKIAELDARVAHLERVQIRDVAAMLLSRSRGGPP